MCQLLGLSSNKNVDIRFSLREFRHRGQQNNHGWGFAFYQNGNWNVIKEPGPLSNEDVNEKRFRFKSKIIIGHVRLASCGSQNHQNTHPFNIKSWVFAHNGTLHSIMTNPEFSLNYFKPLGQTDSEYAFCYLLDKIKISNDTTHINEILNTEASKIKQLGIFNFLLSDGETLFAHGHNRLYFVQRKAPFEKVTLKDEQYSLDLNDIKAPDERAVLIATERLTKNEDWKPIAGIKIFRNGEACDE